MPETTSPRQQYTGILLIPPATAVAKRTIDICGALIGLAVTLLLTPFITTAIRLDSPGPILFRQPRAGLEGRPFIAYKFRSMSHNPQTATTKIIAKNRHDPRITRIGRFLRRWSLDELPQFWNMLKGEISLVGPRPEDIHIVAQYNEQQRQCLLVKPGLTGPMQIAGRGNLSTEQRLQLDLTYIGHITLRGDLLIILRTIPAVIRGTGAY
ncbi:MAG: sugar transferase [Chloroflexi bacterium]|nr:sugar transferase [Chloroflexota bacterium]